MDRKNRTERGGTGRPDEPAETRAYRPEPVDTSGVVITPEILALTEVLARNTHENWARQRLSDGWRWGPARDDAKREHPCLVAYDDLPESERDYDRRTALETIRLVLALGYRIVSPRGAASPAPCAVRRPAASPSPSPRGCARRTRS